MLAAQMESRDTLRARCARILNRCLEDGGFDDGGIAYKSSTAGDGENHREAMRVVVERCVNILAAMGDAGATPLKERMLATMPWLNAKETCGK